MSKTKYERYLKSGAWAEKKAQTFQLYGKKCYTCASEHNLHVHHKTYKRLYKERVEIDLVPLCNECHDQLHRIQKDKNMNVWAATEHFFDTFGTRGKNSFRKKKRRENRKRRRHHVEFRPARVFSHKTAHIPYHQQAQPKKTVTIDLIRFMTENHLDEATARNILGL